MDQEHDFVMTHCISSWILKSPANAKQVAAVRQGVPELMLRRFVARNYSDSATGLQQPGKKV
jgi:hypothetical protein